MDRTDVTVRAGFAVVHAAPPACRGLAGEPTHEDKAGRPSERDARNHLLAQGVPAIN